MKLLVNHLQFSYAERPVLQDLSFSASDGQITAILGRNGSGKSTLFHLLLGLLRPAGGTIQIDGSSLALCTARELARRIAYIPQRKAQPFPFTVREMVLMGTNPRLSLLAQPGRREMDVTDAALARLHLEDFAERRFDQLSGGEAQLVLLARALAQESRILLLDEPTSDLDLGHSSEVMTVLRELADDGYLVLLSTHQPQQVFNYADQVLLLEGGRSTAFGKPAEVLTEASLTALYQVSVRLLQNTAGEVAVLASADKNTVFAERKKL